MATLTIKNVPEALHRRLKERAQTHRRSLNSEALLCLEIATRQVPVDEELLLEELRLLRDQAEVYLTDDALRRAIDEGRP